MPVPLLAFALGGAALGALANPEDRKKGALMGLGAGLLAPLAAPALAGGGAAAGGTVGSGTALGATSAATPVMTGTGAMGAGAAGQGTAALAGKAMANPVGIQSILPGAGIGTGGVAHTGTMGSKLAAAAQGAASKTGEFIAAEAPGVAKDVAAASLISQATKQGPGAPPPAQSMALRAQQQPSESLYDRAAVNRQARMKKRQQGPKRFI